MNSWTQKKGGAKSDDPMEKLNNEGCKLPCSFHCSSQWKVIHGQPWTITPKKKYKFFGLY
jgi:hypothetical protein